MCVVHIYICFLTANDFVIYFFWWERLDVIQFQLEECPNDFFEDLAYENNFLVHVLKVLIIIFFKILEVIIIYQLF